MQLLLYGMIKQRPFQIGWYMDMATKYPVNFLFVATTSRLFQDVSEERLGPQLIQKLKKEGVNPKQWRLRNFQCMLCPQVVYCCFSHWTRLGVHWGACFDTS